MDDTSTDIQIGAVLNGRFRIERELQRGAMGTIYQATQLSVGREVAVKVLRGQSVATDLALDRFEREALAISRLSHPNTVRLLDYGRAETNGDLFMVMELLEGRTLAETLRQFGKLSTEDVIHVARQVLKSLAEAHAAGIVHRDIKPDNLFVTQVHGERGFVKVLDFGVAKVQGDTLATLTRTGFVIGTLRYMSPEQAFGRELDGRSDLHSLAIVMYEMLTGEPLYRARSLGGLASQLSEPAIPPPHWLTVADARTRGLVQWIWQCLHKRIADRPESVEVALRMLDQLPSSEADADATMVRSKPLPALVGPDAPTRLLRTLEDDDAESTDESDQTALVRRFETRNVRRPKRRSSMMWAPLLALLALLPMGLMGYQAWASRVSYAPATDWHLAHIAAMPVPLESMEPLEPVETPERSAEQPQPSVKPAAVVQPSPPIEKRGAVQSDRLSRRHPMAGWERTVIVRSEPASATVLKGGRRVGRTPIAVSWTSGDDPPALEIAKRRYRTRAVAFDQSAVVTVTLRRKRRVAVPVSNKDPYAIPQ